MNLNHGKARQLVLLIDDDESVAASLYQYLLTQGCEVHAAVDATSAARLMVARQYDVVVVDPYLTGRVLHEEDGLLDTIRNLQPEASLIVLTAYSSPLLEASAERLHAAALLAKPQSVVYLSQLVGDASRYAAPPLPSIKGQPE